VHFLLKKNVKFGSTVAYFCEIEKCIVPAKHIPKCKFYAENAKKMCISMIYASFFQYMLDDNTQPFLQVISIK
jgi:hypothetical protein